MNSHGSRILDQFTRQAVPFSQSPSVSNQKALELIVRSADAGPEDTVRARIDGDYAGKREQLEGSPVEVRALDHQEEREGLAYWHSFPCRQ